MRLYFLAILLGWALDNGSHKNDAALGVSTDSLQTSRVDHSLDSQNPSAETMWLSIEKAYADKDWPKASQLVQQHIKNFGPSSAAYLNLAEIERRQDHLVRSLTYVREAQNFERFSWSVFDLENLLRQQLQIPARTHFDFFLAETPWHIFVVALALASIFIGAQCYRAQKISTGLVASWALALAIFVFLYLQGNGPDATLQERTEIRTYPDSAAPQVATIPDGFGLSIVAQRSGWVQVQAAGFPTGWLPMDRIFVHSGHERNLESKK